MNKNEILNEIKMYLRMLYLATASVYVVSSITGLPWIVPLWFLFLLGYDTLWRGSRNPRIIADYLFMIVVTAIPAAVFMVYHTPTLFDFLLGRELNTWYK